MSCIQVNLKINQDWSELIKRYEVTRRFCIKHPETGKWRDALVMNRHDFGHNGSYAFFNSITKNPGTAGCLSGSIVESMLPWAAKLREDLKGLTIDSIAFQGNREGLHPHTDLKDEVLTGHCKLNYMINDQDYTTFVDSGTGIMSHPTKKDTAWLLDTTKYHWVNGQGMRYIFQLTFKDPFDKVQEYLEQRNLSYGFTE